MLFDERLALDGDALEQALFGSRRPGIVVAVPAPRRPRRRCVAVAVRASRCRNELLGRRLRDVRKSISMTTIPPTPEDTMAPAPGRRSIDVATFGNERCTGCVRVMAPAYAWGR